MVRLALPLKGLILFDQTICPCVFAALDFIGLNLKPCFVLPKAGIESVLTE